MILGPIRIPKCSRCHGPGFRQCHACSRDACDLHAVECRHGGAVCDACRASGRCTPTNAPSGAYDKLHPMEASR